MQKEYKTVLSHAITEMDEKRSRFISSVKPVSTEEEALDFVDSLKSRYWDASHNVYTYYISRENTIQRFSDDGEPSGTAGLPVLEVIKRAGVQDLVIVVTRYFGGILLGAAGLIRAYSKSAALGIEAASVVTKKLCTEMNVIAEYTLLGKIQNFLSSHGYILKNIKYGQDAEITVLVPVNDNNDEVFLTQLNEVTSARTVVAPGEKIYITFDKDGRYIT